MPMSYDPTGWTYGADPANSPPDALRFTIGDTLAASPLLRDGEVTYLLEVSGGDVLQAAILAIQNLMGGSIGFVDESVGSVSISFSQRLGNLEKILAMLQGRLAVSGAAMVYCGGISRADVAAREADPDRVPPIFAGPESCYRTGSSQCANRLLGRQ